MPSLRTIANVLLGYGRKAETRSGQRFRQPSLTLAYGNHPLHALDVYRAADSPKPLLVFVHGGAWQFGDKTRRLKDAKVPFAHGLGWHFAALNFRMVPEVSVRTMAEDVAAGLTLLFARADELGIDRRKIVLMGHSSGAHLAALVASDPALLGAHGLAPGDLAGVIAIDGAAYDPGAPSTGSAQLQKRLLDPAFAGADLAALSPVAQLEANGASAPPFLIMHTASGFTGAQARLLEQALKNSGDRVERHAFPGTSPLAHIRLSRWFGRAGFPPTVVAQSWIEEILRD
ncbi:alpha/beta hydrolase [Aurantiacibacter suaedae]|uniref:alpha/beta hydrolase n=1 Tax=Aurantiacibacter suaedae TaxID=2545755 RepID=UPI0010FA3C86|nr:alpha/beta hydrolase [Aurantiacibacter suaedae]